MPKILADLLDALPDEQIVRVQGATDIRISAPVVESDRDVTPGGVFVARAGTCC